MSRRALRDDIPAVDRLAIDLASKLQFEGLEHIVTVSAGALALLVTFRTNLIGGHPVHLWLLKASWVALGGAVVLAIWYKLKLSDDLGKLALSESVAEAAKLGRGTEHLVTASAVCFTVGVVALASFGISNL